MSARSVVERYLDEVLNGHNSSAIDELVADESLRQLVGRFREAFPDVEVATNLVVEDGGLVGVNLSGHGTHRGTFQGVPATGRQWTATCSAFYRVTDGRIVDFWINWDVLGILEQIGGVRRAETASV